MRRTDRITGVETAVVRMPIVPEAGAPPQLAGAVRTHMETLLVRVETDEGITGWGEGFGHRIYTATRAALDSFIGPMCVGRDASDPEGLFDDLERNLHGVGRNGPAIYALSAIDIALWDIAAKRAGVPLYQLLGGARCEQLPAYASLLRYGDADTVRHYVERALGRGFLDLKLHEITEAPIAAARRAAPDARIMVDCNCPWTVDQAIEMARRLRPYDLTWLEEPVWPPEDAAGLARVQAEGGIPIAAGENGMRSDFERMFAARSMSFAQPSVTKVGGITEMRRITALAAQADVTVAPHSAYFGPGLLATVHLIAAMGVGTVEHYDADLAADPYHGALTPRGGMVAVPQGPGLGLDPDPAEVARLRVD